MKARVARNLLAWFDSHRRELPWRANRDPYRIWVSEVMLQQTTVAAVVPRFDRFLARFPTVRDLAEADEQQVLKLWEGLGYYRRARHLHSAARQLVRDHGGQLLDDPALWSELPGVGRYILGAVLSQAFDRRLPIVEANSQRVLARMFSYRGNLQESAGRKWAWSAAEAVLSARRPGDFNQAIMELGALICSPKSPKCVACPLARDCAAHRDGLQDTIPLRQAAKEVKPVREVAIVIRRGRLILLGRRPPDAARWQNMWEVPHGEIGEAEDSRNGGLRVAKELAGLAVAMGEPLGVIRHAVTRFAISMECLEARSPRGTPKSNFYAEFRWVALEDLDTFPASSPQRRLLGLLQKTGKRPK